MEVERWTTTRFYRLEFSSDQAISRAQGKTPYKLEVTLRLDEIDDTDATKERDEGEFEITSITDCYDNSVPVKDLAFLLRTLKKEEDEGCWLDTGILY